MKSDCTRTQTPLFPKARLGPSVATEGIWNLQVAKLKHLTFGRRNSLPQQFQNISWRWLRAYSLRLVHIYSIHIEIYLPTACDPFKSQVAWIIYFVSKFIFFTQKTFSRATSLPSCQLSWNHNCRKLNTLWSSNQIQHCCLLDSYAAKISLFHWNRTSQTNFAQGLCNVFKIQPFLKRKPWRLKYCLVKIYATEQWHFISFLELMFCITITLHAAEQANDKVFSGIIQYIQNKPFQNRKIWHLKLFYNQGLWYS